MTYTQTASPDAPSPLPIPRATPVSLPPLPRVVYMDPFETERRVFAQRLRTLLQSHAGQFVAIHGDDVLGTSATFEGAVELGFTKTGQRSFLVRRIEEETLPLIVPAQVA